MPSLEELRKKLYGREKFEREKREDLRRGYQRRPEEESKKFWGEEDLADGRRKPSAPKRSRWLLNIFIFSFVVLLGVVGYVAYEILVVREEVRLTIAGPTEVETGERTKFAIFVKNTGRTGLADVELNIVYPEHTIALSVAGEPRGVSREKVVLGRISPGEEVRHEILLIFLGKPGDQRTVSALAIYRPENIQSRLTKKAEFATAVTRSPFVITIESPEEVARDQEITLKFTVTSEAKSVLDDISFRIDYPPGFEFVSASPAPTLEKNIWSFGTLRQGESRIIALKGKLSGQPEEIKTFGGVVGQFNPDTKEWLAFFEEARGPKIAAPFLFVRQEMNGRREGTVNGGEDLRFSIFYKNNLSRAMNNIVVTARLGEAVLNLTTLRVDDGAYNPVNREIRWDPASFPDLEELGPGDEGRVSFSVTLRPSPPLKSFSDKNFTLTSLAAIDTKSIPDEFRGVKLRYEDRLEFKINTRLTMNTRSTYVDSPVQNSGPLPPKVRKETTYTIYWRLANQSNDAVNAEVKGGLPANVKWLGPVGTASGNVVFNNATSEVRWSIPRLAAGTGIIKPQETLIFRVALVPGEDQVGTSPILVGNVVAEGADSFTNERLRVEAGSITTALQTDTASDFEQWKVVE